MTAPDERSSTEVLGDQPSGNKTDSATRLTHSGKQQHGFDLGSPKLSVPPGLVDDHDAAGRVRHVPRDGVDGKSAVVKTCLFLSGRHQHRVERTPKRQRPERRGHRWSGDTRQLLRGERWMYVVHVQSSTSTGNFVVYVAVAYGGGTTV